MFEPTQNCEPAESPDLEHSTQPAGYLDRNQLLEAIVCDLHWTALHVGALASLASACVQSDRSWTLRAWRHLLYDNSNIVLLGLRYSGCIGLSIATETALSQFYSTLSTTKRLTAPLISGASGYSAAERTMLAGVAAKWRQLSREAKAAICLLDKDARSQLTAVYSDNSLVLAAFLDGASNGSSECVNQWGEIDLPVLCQRRRVPRTEVRQNCQLSFEGLTIPAVLIDVSANGAGVLCEHTLIPNQMVNLTVGTQGPKKAIVAWSNGGRVGLKFMPGQR